MYKRIITALLASTILLAGCGNTQTDSSSVIDITSNTVVSSTGSEISSEEVTGKDLSFTETATLNQYPELEILASPQNKMATLPGEVFPVKVVVKNNGTESVSYVRGSSRFTTPDALVLDMPGLQVVPAEDHLGMATADLVYDILEPGQSLDYILYVAAIEPQGNFTEIAMNAYQDNQNYVGNMSAEELKKVDPDLVPAETGAYTGVAYFSYTLLSPESDTDPVNPPTGYTSAEFSITVSQ